MRATISKLESWNVVTDDELDRFTIWTSAGVNFMPGLRQLRPGRAWCIREFWKHVILVVIGDFLSSIYIQLQTGNYVIYLFLHLHFWMKPVLLFELSSIFPFLFEGGYKTSRKYNLLTSTSSQTQEHDKDNAQWQWHLTSWQAPSPRPRLSLTKPSCWSLLTKWRN